MFIDYQKACDRVNRHKLLQYLESLGCGGIFVVAPQRSTATTGIIGMESFGTRTGVKQGGSSTVRLFPAYINLTLDAVNSLGPDNWLEDTHALLMMDDTAIVATSGEISVRKTNAVD